MDRRTYFKQMALATGGVFIAPQLLVSCDGGSKVSLTGKYTLEPFASLEEMRNAARYSKGHLTEEMKRLITKKDAKAIFEFVKNRFSIIPPDGNSISNSVYNTRWGKRGALRCGKGTMREISDILFYMYQEAGFNPEYYRGTFPLSKALINNIFCSTKLTNDAVEVSKEYQKKWNENLTQNDVEEVSLKIENIEEKSKTLTKKIWSNLPTDVHENVQHIDWLNIYNEELKTTEHLEVPIVRIKEDRIIKDLHFFEEKKFENFKKFKNRLYDLPINKPNKKYDKIRIIIRVNYSDNLNYPIELVRGEWDFESLIGKQIALQFSPPTPVKNQLLSTYEQINSFIPFLTIRDPKMSDDERLQNSFNGVGFDMLGNTFEKTKKGIRVNDTILNETNKVDTSKVTTLKVIVSNASYPKIQVRLAPIDNQGEVIYGLDVNSFSISDNEDFVAPFLTSNFKNTRLLILTDISSSMPYGKTKLSYEEQATIITGFEKYYDQPIITSKTYSGQLIEKLQQIDPKMYDHIMFISDTGEFSQFSTADSEFFIEKFKATTYSFHFVSNFKKISFENNPLRKLFKEKNQFFKWENIDKSIVAIAKLIHQKQAYPYVLTYEPSQKSKDKNSLHKVIISINGKSSAKAQQTTYELDKDKYYNNYSFPCGLSMEMQWKEGHRSKSITKTLVGYDERIHKPNNFLALKIFNKELKSYALGTHLICFEADKPTYPMLLDDLLTANLTAAPLAESNSKKLEDNLNKLTSIFPLPVESLSTFIGIHSPVSENRVTFENNFQSCFYSEYYDVNTQKSIRKIDMLPTSDIRTFATTKKEIFEKTLEQTSFLALSESHLFSKSTFSNLNEVGLQLFKGTKEEQNLPLYAILKYNKSHQYHLLYDRTKTTNSYWQINKNTGALLGILPDGSGGGYFSQEERIKVAIKIIETWSEAYVKAFNGGMMMGLAQLLALLIAEMFGVAALVINDVGVKQIDLDKRINPILKKYGKKGIKRVSKGLL